MGNIVTYLLLLSEGCDAPSALTGTTTPDGDIGYANDDTFTYECAGETVYVGDRSADLTITCTGGSWSTVTPPSCVGKLYVVFRCLGLQKYD